MAKLYNDAIREDFESLESMINNRTAMETLNRLRRFVGGLRRRRAEAKQRLADEVAAHDQTCADLREAKRRINKATDTLRLLVHSPNGIEPHPLVRTALEHLTPKED